MPLVRNAVDPAKFNPAIALPYELRIEDFRIAMQDVYDFFFDVNGYLRSKGLERLDDMLRPAIMSGLLSDMLSASGILERTTRGYRSLFPADVQVRFTAPQSQALPGAESPFVRRR